MVRIGMGYDVHRLVTGRKLILGGVEIPFEYGLLGHSDADVLLHAIADALLGAAALGDIGRWFPDTDPRFAGISSLVLLGEAYRRLAGAGYQVNNVDSVVVAQRPKLAPYLARMQEKISGCLEIAPDRVNIKATTEEGLGLTGTGQGMAAYAAVTIFKQ
ncbi:MAG: 2-C-methyl-D-erythritol 2,4-cyclodiphosphate synthase [Firmicutes bacterium]|nr:2-C-methyl-D-erythritol 2,4-cyclodiphosphate synthase [Bacillota bacterium]